MGEAVPNVILDAENFGSNCLKIKDGPVVKLPGD